MKVIALFCQNEKIW